MIPRSYLFAPADSAAKMEKACRSGADAVILDLEDSVSEANKPAARGAVAEFLAAKADWGGVQLWVRINPLSGPHAAADLDEIVCRGPFGIVLPKPDSADDVAWLDAELDRREGAVDPDQTRIAILPIATETPKSVFNLHTYADVSSRLFGMTWGAEDLSSAIGAVSARDEQGGLTEPYQIARALCLAGAAAAGVPAVETVFPAFRDIEGLRAYVARGRRDGFTGMMAIHPAQVEVINEGFTPSPEEVAFAEQVVKLFRANPGAATLALAGKMLDRPHLVQAERLLSRVRR